MKRFLPMLAAVLLQAAFSYAVPPYGDIETDRPVCRVDRTAFLTRSAALKAAPFFQTPLSPTTAYVLVIRVDFSDQTMTKTKAQAESFFDSVKSFYLENSYGVLSVSATVTNRGTGGSAGANGAYRLPQSMATYGQGICSLYDTLAKDALSAADPDVNLAAAQSGRRYNHIMIYHAGIGAETNSDSGCQKDAIWSVFAPTVPASSPVTDGIRTPFTGDGVLFNGVTVVPESETSPVDPLGVICHEYGHQLGLPDLYESTSKSAVGKWSLMDAGIYIGSPQGSNPSHLDAWSKQFLGFSQPQTVTNALGQTFTLNQAETSRTAFLRVPIDVSSVGGTLEYFLLEYRRKSGATYDTALPGEGVLIWHVDDSIAANESRLTANTVNTNSAQRGLDLEEADTTDPSATSAQGDSGDPWTSGTFATPKSNANNGKESGIVASAFAGSGGTSMTLSVTKLAAASNQDISRAFTYPNPAGPSYPKGPRAAADTLATVVFEVSRPFTQAKFTIHDLSGALVKNIPESEIVLQAGNNKPSTDNKWVYEYQWNGKNEQSEPVASGIYLFRLKVDESKIKTGKFIIVR